jgi:hypothetical protein
MSQAAASKPTLRPREEDRLHSRVLKCTLESANSRIFWVESAAQQSMPDKITLIALRLDCLHLPFYCCWRCNGNRL